jgi:hypothetical protein
MINGYLAEWTALSPQAKNEDFKAFDGSPFTWARFWPRFAEWYGLRTSPLGAAAKYESTVAYEASRR